MYAAAIIGWILQLITRLLMYISDTRTKLQSDAASAADQSSRLV